MPGTSTKTTRFILRVPNELLAALRREAEARDVSVAAVMLERLTGEPAGKAPAPCPRQ